MRCLKHPDEDAATCPICLWSVDDGPRGITFGDQPTIAWLLTLSDRAFLHRQHLAVVKGL